MCVASIVRCLFNLALTVGLLLSAIAFLTPYWKTAEVNGERRDVGLLYQICYNTNLTNALKPSIDMSSWKVDQNIKNSFDNSIAALTSYWNDCSRGFQAQMEVYEKATAIFMFLAVACCIAAAAWSCALGCLCCCRSWIDLILILLSFAATLFELFAVVLYGVGTKDKINFQLELNTMVGFHNMMEQLRLSVGASMYIAMCGTMTMAVATALSIVLTTVEKVYEEI